MERNESRQAKRQVRRDAAKTKQTGYPLPETLRRCYHRRGSIEALNSALRLTDPQRIQCRIVDLTGNGKLVDGLEPANRSFRLRADRAIDVTVIKTPSCVFAASDSALMLLVFAFDE
jgi:hypothetical protein